MTNTMTVPGGPGLEKIDLDTASLDRLRRARADIRYRRTAARARLATLAQRRRDGIAAGNLLGDRQFEVVQVAKRRRQAVRQARDSYRDAARRWALREMISAAAALRRARVQFEAVAGLVGGALEVALSRLAATSEIDRLMMRAEDAADADDGLICQLESQIARREAEADLAALSDAALQDALRQRRQEELDAAAKCLVAQLSWPHDLSEIRAADARARGRLVAVHDEIAWRAKNGRRQHADDYAYGSTHRPDSASAVPPADADLADDEETANSLSDRPRG